MDDPNENIRSYIRPPHDARAVRWVLVGLVVFWGLMLWWWL